jgi:phosphoglycolate phosphatase
VSDAATNRPAGRVRPFSTVLDTLRVEIDHDAFDVVICSLESVAADLGYGDIRALPGSVAWLERLRGHGKRLGLFATGDRATAALELAGITDLFDTASTGTLPQAALVAALDELDVEPRRAIVVAGSAAAVAAAREVDVALVIAVARGLSSPEQLRQAGANAVVADLQELLGAVT